MGVWSRFGGQKIRDNATKTPPPPPVSGQSSSGRAFPVDGVPGHNTCQWLAATPDGRPSGLAARASSSISALGTGRGGSRFSFTTFRGATFLRVPLSRTSVPQRIRLRCLSLALHPTLRWGGENEGEHPGESTSPPFSIRSID